jgi:uncharacterized protein YycO
MPRILVIFIVLATQIGSAYAHNLKTGDVLLQPLKCWACTLIEEQEDSLYSHIGVYLNIDGKDMVAEAYGRVQLVSLETFLSKTEAGLKVVAKRHFDYEKLDAKFIAKTLKYIGNPYDHYFLWNNEVKGKEAIYCSELLFKAMAPFVSFNDLSTKEMLFDINPELWDRYFRGETPRYKQGISPEDFNLSSDFFYVEEL